MTPATATNPYEAKARLTKAIAIADLIWENLSDNDRLSPVLSDIVAGRTQAERDGFATAAGQRSPSAATWALVAARIRHMGAAERDRGLVVPVHVLTYHSVYKPHLTLDDDDVMPCETCEVWGHDDECEHCRGSGLVHGYDDGGLGQPVTVRRHVEWRKLGTDSDTGVDATQGPESPLPPAA